MDHKSLFTYKEDGAVTIDIHPAENNIADLKLTIEFFIEYHELVYNFATKLDIQKIQAWAAFHCAVLKCKNNQANDAIVRTYLKIAMVLYLFVIMILINTLSNM